MLIATQHDVTAAACNWELLRWVYFSIAAGEFQYPDSCHYLSDYTFFPFEANTHQLSRKSGGSFTPATVDSLRTETTPAVTAKEKQLKPLGA